MSLDDLAQFWIRKNIAMIVVLIFDILKKIRRLIGSRMIESTTYYNQTLLTLLYLNSIQNKSGNWKKLVFDITFMLAQTDSIKRRAFWYTRTETDCSDFNLNLKSNFFKEFSYVRTIQNKLLMSRLQKTNWREMTSHPVNTLVTLYRVLKRV